VTDNHPDEGFILKITPEQVTSATATSVGPDVAVPPSPSSAVGTTPAPTPTPPENIRHVFSPDDRPADVRHVEVDSDSHADEPKDGKRET
jgi:hypothetical protein